MESKKRYLISVLILFVSNFIFSQTIFEKKIWIKADTINLSNPTSKDTLFLNFNEFVKVTNSYPNDNLKNIVNNNGSFFLVFKSNEREDNLILLKNKIFSTKISSSKIISDKEFEFKQSDSKKGTLISYHYNFKSKKKRKRGDIILNASFFESDKSKLYELIYFPEIIGNKKRKAIESYLSIKYGISLLDDKNYINSKLDTIWNYKSNKEFSNNITGLGKDSVFELNQKQSVNINDENFSIALGEFSNTNSSNKSELFDNSFMLWGDNGKSYKFEKDNTKKNSYLNRVWKLETYSNKNQKFTTQIKIKKSPLKLKDNLKGKICLLIDTLSNSIPNVKSSIIYEISKIEDDYLLFDNVKWDANKSYFFTLAIIDDIEKEINENNEITNLKNEMSPESYNNVNVFSIYPNPTKVDKEFSVYIDLKKKSNVSIAIIDISGKKILDKNLGNVSKIVENESLRSAGVFIIKVQIDDQILSHKLIVE